MANGHLGAEKCSGTNYCTTGCNLVLRENLLIFLQGLSWQVSDKSDERHSGYKIQKKNYDKFFLEIYLSKMGQNFRKLRSEENIFKDCWLSFTYLGNLFFGTIYQIYFSVLWLWGRAASIIFLILGDFRSILSDSV